MDHVQNLRKQLLSGPGRSRQPVDLAATAAFAAGGGLLVWSAVHPFPAVERDRLGTAPSPSVGPLFLLQSVVGLVLGVGVVAVRRLWAAVLGIGFALATMASFLVSVAHGLFGFKDSWLAPSPRRPSPWRSSPR